MKLKLGFSPCPNDTFIFDAMVHGKIETEGLEFDYFLADVEELNRRAFASEVDITKVSCHAYPYIANDYLIMDSGSALGFGNGPLLISKNSIDLSELARLRIAIPGKFTTANLLLSIAWPEAGNKKEYLFSEIEDAIIRGDADAGIIIHETRFTYQEKGLLKIADMGEYWDKLTGLPIPLGNIVINRKIPEDIAKRVNRAIRRSIKFAKANKMSSFDFVSANAKEMDHNVMNKHISLYVNKFSLQLGWQGRKALRELFRIAGEKGITPAVADNIFL